MRRFFLITLGSFSQTGGIEKFNRALMKAFISLASTVPISFRASGMYDKVTDEAYIPSSQYYAGKGWRWLFTGRVLWRGLHVDELIIGHINLSAIGLLIKWLRPSVKITLVCHGIEVFQHVSGIKKFFLSKVDRFLAVSQYTKLQLEVIQRVPAHKIKVFPNTLDPYFHLPSRFEKPGYLMKRYDIAADEKVLFTLTRLDSSEGYKGYDTVIRSIPELMKAGYRIKYIIGGKADKKEKEALTHLIHTLGLQAQVLLTGFIAEEEVTDHYLLADIYVMPSKGEGFGIVFLEAMACGTPVIAGNKDGSSEALRFGQLGTLIDPDNDEAIQKALIDVLIQPKQPEALQQATLSYFSFEKFTERLEQVFLN